MSTLDNAMLSNWVYSYTDGVASPPPAYRGAAVVPAVY